MTAGKFNRRIALQRSTVVRNVRNEPITTFANIATVWAERMDVSSGESYRAQEVGSQLTSRFRIRYSTQVADLNPNDRLVYLNQVYNITGVREVKMNRILEIDAVVRNDDPAAGL